MEEQRLKVELELHVVGDGRVFLNFWNYMTGEDALAEVKDGKLISTIYDDNVEVISEEEITLQEFIDRVKSKFKKK